MEAEPTGRRGDEVRVLEKAIEIIHCFSPEAPSLGPSELGRRLGLPRSTVHRILSVLTRRGWVVRDPDSGRY